MENTKADRFNGLYDLESPRAQQLVAEQKAAGRRVDLDTIKTCLIGERLAVARVEATFKLLYDPGETVDGVSGRLNLPGNWGQKIASEAGKLVDFVRKDADALLVLASIADTAWMGIRDSKKLVEIKSILGS